MTTLANGDKIVLREVPEDSRAFTKTDLGNITYLHGRGDKNYTSVIMLDGKKFLGTLQSGIFTGSGLLRDEQRVALLSADPDKKYVILLETKK